MYVLGLYKELELRHLKRVMRGLCLLLVLKSSRGQDDHHVLRLHNDLINNNNPKVRPVKNSSDTITVSLELHLLSMSDFDEVTQTVTANGFFLVSWKDEFLTWNASEYGGVREITPDYGKVWRPYIIVRNVVDRVQPLGLDFGVIKVTSQGIVSWSPGDNYKTFCQMDVTNFPLDEQECSYIMFVWASNLKEVELKPSRNSLGLYLFNSNSEWDIVDSSSGKVPIDITDTPFGFVYFNMTLRRKPYLAILTILLPVLVLGLVNVMVFLIPGESGEKVSFAITVLLSFTVSLSFVTGLLPQNGDCIPVFTVLIVGLFIMSSTYVFLAIWIVHMFHRDTTIRPVPAWMGRMTKSWERCFCGTPAVGHQETSTQEKMSKETSDPSSITWVQVSRMADRIFFYFFLMLFTITAICGYLKIACF
ncbi:neuronal acetylcholine receptor subunit alpha-7-like [Haliotis asinina]|uniref:neuronal acetylcholine receptor subunit alpha-7-like n=1 Tax=Haliotis asinina TaxID=109174 RepID=UPI003531AE54